MPHRQKATMEEKLMVVHAYFSGEITVAGAAQRLKVSKRTIRDWIKWYESEGSEFFLPREQNSVYTATIKMQAVNDYLNGTGSMRAICRKYRIRSHTQLRNWIKLYNAHGDVISVKHPGGGSYMRKAKSTTIEERLQIAKESIASGKNYCELANKYNVSYQQVRTWTLRYEKLGVQGLEDRRGKRKKDQIPRTELEKAKIEIEKLKHQLYVTEMERDLLKKLNELERGESWASKTKPYL